MPAPRKYSPELRERALRLYRESDPKPVVKRLAEQLGIHPEALRTWIRQDQATAASVMICPPLRWSRRTGGFAKRWPSSAGPTKS